MFGILTRETTGRETTFKDKGDEGVNYFSNLFKENSRATIFEVIRLSNSFPIFVNDKTSMGKECNSTLG
jgi:hypothetical protein